MNETMEQGIQNLLGPLVAVAQTRSAGGSIEDETRALNQAVVKSPTVRLELEQKYADQDAKRLVFLYDENPEAFRKIYAGMEAFIKR